MRRGVFLLADVHNYASQGGHQPPTSMLENSERRRLCASAQDAVDLVDGGGDYGRRKQGGAGELFSGEVLQCQRVGSFLYIVRRVGGGATSAGATLGKGGMGVFEKGEIHALLLHEHSHREKASCVFGVSCAVPV